MFVKTVWGCDVDSEINELITVYGNGQGATKMQRQFLERCLSIHEEYGRPFACYDFPNIPGGSFRQYIRKLKNFVEIAYKSNPCYYRVKGTPFKKRAPKVTHRPTGEDMIRITTAAALFRRAIVPFRTLCQDWPARARKNLTRCAQILGTMQS